MGNNEPPATIPQQRHTLDNKHLRQFSLNVNRLGCENVISPITPADETPSLSNTFSLYNPRLEQNNNRKRLTPFAMFSSIVEREKRRVSNSPRKAESEKEDVSKSMQETEAMKKTCFELETQLEELSNQLRLRMKLDEAVIKQRINAKKCRVDKSEATNDSMNSDSDTSVIPDITEKSLQIEIETLQKTVQEQTEHFKEQELLWKEQLEARLEERAKYEQLVVQYEDVHSRYHDVMETLNQVQMEKNLVSEQLQKLSQVHTSAIPDMLRLRKELEEMQMYRDQTLELVEQLQKSRGLVAQELVEEKEKNIKQSEEASNFVFELNELHNQLSISEGQVQDLQQKVESVESKYEQVAQQLVQSNELITELQKTKQDIKQKWKQSQVNENNYLQQLGALRLEKSKWKSYVEILKKKHAEELLTVITTTEVNNKAQQVVNDLNTRYRATSMDVLKHSISSRKKFTRIEFRNEQPSRVRLFRLFPFIHNLLQTSSYILDSIMILLSMGMVVFTIILVSFTRRREWK